MAEFLVLAVVALVAAAVGASIKDRLYEQRLAPLRRAWHSRPYDEISQDRFAAMGSPWMVLPPASDGGYKMFVDPFSSDLIVDVTSASLWQGHKDWNIGIAKGGRYDEVDTKLDRAHWEWVQDVWSTAGALLGEDRGSTITYRSHHTPTSTNADAKTTHRTERPVLGLKMINSGAIRPQQTRPPQNNTLCNPPKR